MVAVTEMVMDASFVSIAEAAVPMVIAAVAIQIAVTASLHFHQEVVAPTLTLASTASKREPSSLSITRTLSSSISPPSSLPAPETSTLPLHPSTGCQMANSHATKRDSTELQLEPQERVKCLKLPCTSRETLILGDLMKLPLGCTILLKSS